MKCPQVLNSLVLLQFVIVSVANDDEIDKRRTSNVCRSSADCPTNASCEPRSGLDGQCVCRTGYFMKAAGKTRACIQIADYGELCYLHQQCEFRLGLFSECKNSQCSCKDGSHYIVAENACVKSSKVGDYCRLTSNCAVELTTCVRGECRCPIGSHPNPERNRCLKDVELNEPCSTHDECIEPNSICYRQCKCRTSHVTSQDGKRCLPFATVLHQKCEEDTQCAQIPNSCCGGNKTCVCNNGHHDINSRCLVSARLNGPCDDDDNCVAAHSSCVDKKCTCDEGFHEFRGKFCSAAVKVQISVLVFFVLGFLRLLV